MTDHDRPAPRRERDIDTELIRRTVDEIQRGQRPPTPTPGVGSGEHPVYPCHEHAMRLTHLEKAKDEHASQLQEHEDRLGEGVQQFTKLEMGMAHLAEKVGTLNGILFWVGAAIGLGLLGTAGAALLYVIFLMGGKP